MTALTLTLLLVSQISLMADYPWQQEDYRPADVELLNTLAIVSPIRYHERELRTATDPAGNEWTAPVVVEEVRVLDSNRKLDEVMRIVHPFGSIDHTMPGAEKAMYRFQPGKKYLLWLYLEAEGKLVLPGIAAKNADGEPYLRYFNVLERKHSNEVMGLAAFATQQSKLDLSGESAIDRLMVNVALGGHGATGPELWRLLSFLSNARYGSFQYPIQGTNEKRTAEIRDDAPVIPILFEIAAKVNPSDAARIYSLLGKWGVPGSTEKLLSVLPAASQDPTLGANEADCFHRGFVFDPLAVVTLKETPLERAEKWDALLRMALDGKSRAVLELILNNVSGTLDLELQKRVLQLALVQTDEFFAIRLFGFLRRSANDPELEPRRERVDGKWQWVNRQQLIDFWKERLGLPPLAAHADRGS